MALGRFRRLGAIPKCHIQTCDQPDGSTALSVNSILTNSSALAALQSLNMTEQNLTTTQNQVSTGLAVANASQNAAYWSIGQQLGSDSGIVSATNSALAQSQAVFDTATTAINSVITTINSMATALTEAANTGANLTDINTTLASLASQLTDAVNGASFNGTNILNGSNPNGTPINFVSGFDATATGGTISTIAFSPSALTGASTVPSTSVQPTITNATTIADLVALPDNTGTVTAASYGNDVIDRTTDTSFDTFTITSVALDGTKTATTYTGLDANGNTIQAFTSVGPPPVQNPNLASLAVSETTTPVGTSTGLLYQGTTNLTTLGTGLQVSSANATTVLLAVTTYSSTIGATQDRMTAASTLNSALTVNYANGISALVDADMNTASTRLQALQTQQQLGIQSLSIANQNSQLILKLFNG
jgi:flagellin